MQHEILRSDLYNDYKCCWCTIYSVAYSINLSSSLETTEMVFLKKKIELNMSYSNENTRTSRYKPQANRHMFSAYAKYTMQSGNNRQTPANMHGKFIHTFAYVCTCVCEKESEDWGNTFKKKHRKIRKRWKWKSIVPVRLYVCESKNLNKSRTYKGNNIITSLHIQ